MTSDVYAIEAERELAKRELARRHLLDFIAYVLPGYQVNWHHRIIAEKLEGVANGTIKRLMLFMPPRHGKTEEASIQFPAWYLGKHPEHEVIVASYAADLAVDFGRKTRNIINERRYQNVFTTILAEDSKSAGRWNTQDGGAYVAVGVGGGITGRGAHLLVIDDPVKNREEADSPVKQVRAWDWYRSTAYTRLAPEGAVILIMTRWNEDDLAGKLLKEQENGGDKWDIVQFPAIAQNDEEYRDAGEALWPERFSLERLAQVKGTLGSREWLCLYQQNPVDDLHSEFKKAHRKYRTRAEVEHLQTQRYLTIDTAISERDADDSTGWVENYVDPQNSWNVSARRLRVNSAELIRLLFVEYETKRFDKIGIEKTIYTQAIAPFLEQEQRKRNVFLPIVELLHGGTAKHTRIRGLIPRYEAGAVYHIANETLELEEEQVKFPAGAHDDVLDALAYQLQIAEAPRDDIDREMREKIRQAHQNRVTFK